LLRELDPWAIFFFERTEIVRIIILRRKRDSKGIIEDNKGHPTVTKNKSTKKIHKKTTTLETSYGSPRIGAVSS
jgi:hypothetical protein